MLRTAALSCLVALASPLAAQSGTVRYDQANRIDLNLPSYSPLRGRIPKAAVRPMQLRYSPGATLFGPAPRESNSSSSAGPVRADVMMITKSGREVALDGGNFAFRRAGSAGAGRVTGAFTNLDNGNYTEIQEFLGRTFRISEPRPTFPWKLTGEQATFLGHPVYQATAQQDSTSIEAWFTPDIPIPAGPAQYGGLPGLILTLAVDSNRVTYTATAVDTTATFEAIKAPSDGREVTRDEYDRIVAEKQAELRKSRRGRRDN